MAKKVLVITTNTLIPGIKKYMERAGVGKSDDTEVAFFKARQAVALQLLNFTVNGSANEKVVPPIRWGILRGSGSAFVDGTLVGDTKSSNPDGTPNREYKCPKNGAAIGFNTAYAARMHESKWVPGGVVPSKQAAANPSMLADVGNKFVEKHLKADREVLLGLFADIFKKETGA